MFTTSRTFRFSAAHALDHLEEGRQCAHLHGHNYTVEVILQVRTLSSDSFVRDPIEVDRIGRFIRRALDRTNLNEVFAAEFENDVREQYLPHEIASWNQSLSANAEVEQKVTDALRTTTENIARCIFWRLRKDFPELWAVKVWDQCDSWAMYSTEGGRE